MRRAPYDLTLVIDNVHDFAGIPGLHVVAWLAP